eukprot:gene5176-3723_t
MSNNRSISFSTPTGIAMDISHVSLNLIDLLSQSSLLHIAFTTIIIIIKPNLRRPIAYQ